MTLDPASTLDRCTTPRRWPRSASGFTLLEIVTVVAILALLASMAQLSAADRSQQSVDMATIQVRDALDRARALARSKRQAHGVVFDIVEDRLVVTDSEGAPTIDPLTRSAYFVEFTRPNQPGGIDIQVADFGASGQSALFDSQGVPLNGGFVILSCGPMSQRLLLDPATGEVSVL